MQLNKRSLEGKRQLEELTTRLKDATEKFNDEKQETWGSVEKYDPQEVNATNESENQLWELIRELDDEEMSDAIQVVKRLFTAGIQSRG